MVCNLNAYGLKSDAELHGLMADAHEAAVNMRAIGDSVAECKYLDQINDACTVLERRRRQALKEKQHA